MTAGIAFTAVVLDARHDDRDAMLAFRDGRLAAVLSCLGDMHGDDAGHWYVEVVFVEPRSSPRETFATLAEVTAWLESLA